MVVSDPDIPPQAPVRDAAGGLHLRVFETDTVPLPVGRWNTRNVRSAFWRFYQNQEAGAFLTLANGDRFDLAPRQLYFVPAGVGFSCGNDTDVTHFYIHFDVIGLPRLAMHALFDGPVALPPNADFEAQVAHFADIVARSPALDLSGQCRAQSLLYDGLAQYLDSLPIALRERATARAADLEPVAPALLHIEAHLAEPLPLKTLAARCHLGPDHFTRRFKACVGQTPVAYLHERRVTRAAQLLLFTDQTIEQIALNCGFGNRHYLTRIFTRAIGTAPVAYRKLGRRDVAA